MVGGLENERLRICLIAGARAQTYSSPSLQHGDLPDPNENYENRGLSITSSIASNKIAAACRAHFRQLVLRIRGVVALVLFSVDFKPTGRVDTTTVVVFWAGLRIMARPDMIRNLVLREVVAYSARSHYESYDADLIRRAHFSMHAMTRLRTGQRARGCFWLGGLHLASVWLGRPSECQFQRFMVPDLDAVSCQVAS